MANNDTYIFYRSFHEAMSELKTEEYGALMYAINEYALNYNDKKIKELKGVTKALWTLIKPQIDANFRRREIGSKNAEYGKMGGRPRKEKTPMGFSSETPTGFLNKTPMGLSTKTPNVNVNVNTNKEFKKDNVNVNDNDNVNVQTSTNTVTDTPTLSLVREYIKSENLNVEAEKFYTYYQARNWQNVTNWRLALLKWNEKQFNNTETQGEKKLKSAAEVLANIDK